MPNNHIKLVIITKRVQQYKNFIDKKLMTI